MREIRRDPSTGEETLLATDRATRPRHLAPGRRLDLDPDHCPFCRGHEAHTPATIAEIGDAHGWLARSFANRYPVLGIEGQLERRAHGPWDRVTGIGAHEVLVEGPDHGIPGWRPRPDAPPRGLDAPLRLARERLRDLRRDGRMRHVTWFRNFGPEAGGTLGHPHAQIVATPFVPAAVRRMTDRFVAHHAAHERDLMGDLLEHDRADGRRIVADLGSVVVVCPYAPRVGWEVWIVPSDPVASFASADEAALAGLADGMARVLRAWDGLLASPPHNALLYTAPIGEERGWRWHVRLLPRFATMAGFELATGAYMVGTAPEDAAARLREVW